MEVQMLFFWFGVHVPCTGMWALLIELSSLLHEGGLALPDVRSWHFLLWPDDLLGCAGRHWLWDRWRKNTKREFEYKENGGKFAILHRGVSRWALLHRHWQREHFSTEECVVTGVNGCWRGIEVCIVSLYLNLALFFRRHKGGILQGRSW